MYLKKKWRMAKCFKKKKKKKKKDVIVEKSENEP